MANENLKELYGKVFQKLKSHPEIEGLKKGILYKIIQIILGEEELPSQERTLKICNDFSIKPHHSLDEDLKKSQEVVKNFSSDRRLYVKFTRTNQDKIPQETIYMEYIFVVAACILVGVYASKKYLDTNQEQKLKLTPTDQGKKQLPVTTTPIAADLCLIIPANVASNLSKHSKLTTLEVTHLIDNASYFLCTKAETADLNEQNLEITGENIPSDSKREVYVRINIDHGRLMMEQKIPYYLKTHLPEDAHCIVKQIACLKNLSGLDKFNRV